MLPAPVRDSLDAAALELGRVAATAEQLQDALSPLLRRAGEAGEAAQALDEIAQHLHGLVGFLAAIAQDCSPDWRVDSSQAVGLLRLHAQKLRIIAPPTLASVAGPLPRSSAHGDLELW